MNILAYFSLYGTPSTGLSPTIRIRDISDNSLVVTDAAMTEVGDGFYKYNFSTYNMAKEYTIRCDGGTTLTGTERYPVAITSGYGELQIIKTQTDKMAFTVANQIDANVLTQANIDFGALQKVSLNAATPASIQNIPADGSGLTAIPTVARVALVDECTLNSDMVGTNDAALAIDLATVAGYLDTEIAAILEDTGTTLPATLATIDGIVDAIKLKTDTINAAGILIWTYTPTDSVTAAPIADVTVILTSDLAGTITIRTSITNSLGVATFFFSPEDSGITVYVWCSKVGYVFTSPDTEVVS